MSESLKIIFCLPGNNFSGKFLDCWSGMLASAPSLGILPILSRRESCNIYYVRNMCLGADVMRGKNQKPFDGKLDYDYLMWIDSDIIFTPEQVTRLISHDKDIVSGLYLMDNGKQFATCREWDEDFFKQHGHFPFLTPGDIKDQTALIDVAYTGFGFMLIKKGVFEEMEYPWFRPVMQEIGNAVDFTMEDVGFCLRAKERGCQIFVDPQVVVGHEKKTVY